MCIEKVKLKFISFDAPQLQRCARELGLEHTQLEQNYTQLKDEYLSTFAPTAMAPPISKLTAINIALTYGGWNATTLEGRVVNAKLCYTKLVDTPKEQEFHAIYEVTTSLPLADYSPVNFGDVFIRFVWYVNISLQRSMKTIPPQGSYLVDAATGEVITFPFVDFNPLW